MNEVKHFGITTMRTRDVLRLEAKRRVTVTAPPSLIVAMDINHVMQKYNK